MILDYISTSVMCRKEKSSFTKKGLNPGVLPPSWQEKKPKSYPISCNVKGTQQK